MRDSANLMRFSLKQNPVHRRSWVSYCFIVCLIIILISNSCTEQELRRICSTFGQVQTCIVNKEKRHAFVKMLDRKGAVLTKEGMEKMKGAGSKFRSVSKNVIHILRGRINTNRRPAGASDLDHVNVPTTQMESASSQSTS